ncbi:hypothetical protein [Streptomyces sp. NPDC048172]|uniref:bestrophin-like domain n=1 Tax=Streptomyces sp. NPDC048172 TaxID=3365505 RepID=UPI0037103CDB
MTTTIVVVAVAFVAGLALNRTLKRRALGEDAPSLGMQDLVGPLLTLAVLLLAFVLVMGAGSYGEAEKAARTEAGAVEQLFEVSGYAARSHREELRSDAVCYARAINHLEWKAMRDGQRSGAASVWTVKIRNQFSRMTDDPQFGTLVSANKERAAARRDRLSQSAPTIPRSLYLFMVLAVSVAVLVLAFCLPFRGGYAQIVTLFILTGLLTLSLLLIKDLDRPFAGAIKVESTNSMSVTENDITAIFAEQYGKKALPCDADGRPL